MGKRLAFGTSGLRGAMGPGFCRINDLVIVQVSGRHAFGGVVLESFSVL